MLCMIVLDKRQIRAMPSYLVMIIGVQITKIHHQLKSLNFVHIRFT